jgi:hypothetical protein
MQQNDTPYVMLVVRIWLVENVKTGFVHEEPDGAIEVSLSHQ